MRNRGNYRSASRMADLQQLATMASRQDLGKACEQTDARAAEDRRTGERHQQVSDAFDAICAQERICLDRLAFASHRLLASDAQLNLARAALREAQQHETSASAGYAESHQRLEWISGHARALQRKHFRKQEDGALIEAIALHAQRKAST